MRRMRLEYLHTTFGLTYGKMQVYILYIHIIYIYTQYMEHVGFSGYSLTITIFCGSSLNRRTGPDEICHSKLLVDNHSSFKISPPTANLTTTGSFMTKMLVFQMCHSSCLKLLNREVYPTKVTSGLFFFLDVFPTTFAPNICWGPRVVVCWMVPICHTGKCETYLSGGFLLGVVGPRQLFGFFTYQSRKTINHNL